MMPAARGLPELEAEPVIADWIASRCAGPDAVVDIEKAALAGCLDDIFFASEPWKTLQEQVQALWKEHDHVIVRGLPAAAHGAALVLLSLALSGRFKTYRGDKVIKHFRMSPWTTDLSHTLQSGHFHTDINTAPTPPLITAIQCRIPDPGAPNFGENRVVRLPDLLHALDRSGELRTLAFLQETVTTMVNDTSPVSWTGCIVSKGRIRFHPETLRAAQRRYGNLPADLEAYLQAIKEAAMAASTPIHLGAGDTLWVSNTRALHYRGACSVVYHAFPRDFTSREIYVLHLLDEPT